jgi:hypothetical protein
MSAVADLLIGEHLGYGSDCAVCAPTGLLVETRGARSRRKQLKANYLVDKAATTVLIPGI